MVEAKVGEAYVEVRYDASSLATSLRGIEATATRQANQLSNKTGGAFSGLGSLLTAPFRGLADSMNSVQGLAAGLGGAIGAISIGSSIVEANTSFERLSGSLKTVTGSAELGQKAF